MNHGLPDIGSRCGLSIGSGLELFQRKAIWTTLDPQQLLCFEKQGDGSPINSDRTAGNVINISIQPEQRPSDFWIFTNILSLPVLQHY